jgi:hypothetical protein
LYLLNNKVEINLISSKVKQLVAILTVLLILDPSSINQTAKARGVKNSEILRGITLIILSLGAKGAVFSASAKPRQEI